MPASISPWRLSLTFRRRTFLCAFSPVVKIPLSSLRDNFGWVIMCARNCSVRMHVYRPPFGFLQSVYNSSNVARQRFCLLRNIPHRSFAGGRRICFGTSGNNVLFSMGRQVCETEQYFASRQKVLETCLMPVAPRYALCEFCLDTMRFSSISFHQLFFRFSSISFRQHFALLQHSFSPTFFSIAKSVVNLSLDSCRCRQVIRASASCPLCPLCENLLAKVKKNFYTARYEQNVGYTLNCHRIICCQKTNNPTIKLLKEPWRKVYRHCVKIFWLYNPLGKLKIGSHTFLCRQGPSVNCNNRQKTSFFVTTCFQRQILLL